MGLINLLTWAASCRAHVLVAEAPGAFRERVALERALDRLGWCMAESVADADVLAVVGEPDEALGAVIEHVWSQMSEPRVRLQLRDEVNARERLSEARDQLRGVARRLNGPDVRRGFTPSADDMADERDDHVEHGDEGGDDHSEMMPDGIALAEGAEDRDGLEMDELHLPLGPVLAHWPAGLVLRITLHGDVVSGAQVEQLRAAPDATPTLDDRLTRVARLLDAAASVLALAGSAKESARARDVRDRCLDGDPPGGPEVAGLGERIGRQRALRWVLGGLAVTGTHSGSQLLHDRLTGLFQRALAELEGAGATAVRVDIRALPDLVRGQELASVRLWLAAAMPDLAEQSWPETAHG